MIRAPDASRPIPLPSGADTGDASNRAYALAFGAAELLAGSRSICFAATAHHRYREHVPRSVLRRVAADWLRLARQLDRPTTRKVWTRHRRAV